jgi:hypothetical protein
VLYAGATVPSGFDRDRRFGEGIAVITRMYTTVPSRLT